MRRIHRARLLASVLLVSVVPFVAAAIPAQAQEQAAISFNSFHNQLAPYGDWVYSDRWGLVWQPADVPDDFRPYHSGGHWADTDRYGWTWVSDYEWGDIAFHYGRWVDDADDGWMWIPGYVWSPGWVVWRRNDRYTGWMAMPPDDEFLGGRGDVSVSVSFGRGGGSSNWNDASGYYGYSRWYGRNYDERRFAANWTFVGTGHMADRDYRPYIVDRSRTVNIFHETRNVTNYTVVNNYVVNRSINVHDVEAAGGHRVRSVAAASVFRRPNLVTTVDAGQRVRTHEIGFAPHGTGIANSAPPPPPAVVNKLSNQVARRHMGGIGAKGGAAGKGPGGPTHLFTKRSIANPAAVSQFHGKLHAGPMGATPAGTLLTPTGPKGLHAGPKGGALGATKMGPGTVAGPKGLHAGPKGGALGATKMGPGTVAGPKGLHAGPKGGVLGAGNLTRGPSGHPVGGVIVSKTHPALHPVTKPVVRRLTKPVPHIVTKPVPHPATNPHMKKKGGKNQPPR